MILDSALILATAYAPTAIGTTYATLANAATSMDLGSLQDWGMGNDWILYIQVNSSFSTAGSPTLQLILQGNDTDPSFASGTTSTVLDTGAITSQTTGGTPERAANWQSGFEKKLKYPRGFNVRYLRLQVIVGTAAFTGGSFNAWLNSDNVQDNITLPKNGYTVL